MIGARIKQAREAKGMTQPELAYIVGVVKHMITMIERGTRQVTAPLLVVLAEVLDVTADWLLYGDRDKGD